ncbi:MAG: metal ABC transporter substrate-binding protein [gamma proteobacterium symbiont of Ctena orbiculata]|nr:metal ABC transporter substrate-binding protein [Candidatus Thiodiazotropha taylori]MBT3059171.1 metal ABC transporter substrate-binding protein [Candidatus Thiodiazotropha sp. (ex Lucina pensylvanica)]MBV2093353.1 metal ABC transporter substrate-binding protein [Candidatus Thiodiazotropha sp. (ex Codakia orbicularis)]PUB74687.1 MAG: metal ABC transporter substrate-binding protein [gamma proteobacterium symbiont of Ctena orbiculata]MBT3065168.1 metal ABC transporter substrate-binding protein
MIPRRSILISVFAAGLFGLFGSIHARADGPVDVVATFSILGDMVRQVGGDRVHVTTLVGPDADGHVYQPTPADARSVAETSLLIVNGLGFEGWIDRLTEASGYKGPVVTATTGVEPAGAGDNDHGEIDPHAWQSLANARIYVRNIADGLAVIDPAGAEIYHSNATRYTKEIDAVEARVRETFGSLPVERRKVVTSHDAFGYFSATYGIEFYAPVGVNTEAEASAGDIARLIRQINKEKIPAVFVENISDRRLLDQIVRETGARIGGTLYSDALSKADGPAGTYLDMMRHNIRVLVDALGI